MPDYVTPLSRAGSAAGAGAGGLLGGILGTVGDTLSAPRRWLWNALGLPEEGSQLASDVFGLDKEGGLAQALGFGAEMLGDPLTYAGGLLGKLGGALAGRKVGQAAEAAAAVRGPRYPGGFEKLAGSGLPPGSSGAAALLEDLQRAPGLARALQEVPPGSQYLGHGVEALALKTPAGDVLRIAPTGDDISRLARPNIPEMLQPTRAGLAGDIRVERTPLADMTFLPVQRGGVEPDFSALARQPYHPDRQRAVLGQMEQTIGQRGYTPVDVHGGNVGQVGGQFQVIDPGAVIPGRLDLPELPDWTKQKQPGRMMNWLLDRLGADEAVRRELGGF